MLIKNDISLIVKYIDETKGFGVFTNETIESGTIVETCYCIKTYNQLINPCFDYLFSLSKTESLLPLGYGSIYNHSNEANIHWRIINLEKLLIEFYSLRKIDAGEELCHNYGQLYWDIRKKKLI